MLKKIKSPGIICIILAITTLILAALIGIIWMLAPSEAEDDFYFQGGLNLGSSNGVLYNVTSDETLGSVYLKTQTYGNFDGKKWDEAVPEYDKLINSEYSANYLTGLALQNSDAKQYSITIKPTTNKYVLPYYVSTNAYGDYENIQTSDIKNEGNANAAYSVYFYKYTAADAVAHSASVAKYESEYSQFVKENYLYVDGDTLAFLDEVIKENGLSASDSDIISKVTLYIRSIAKYDLLYDVELDKEENTVISFMSGEYESGVCRHFASSATLLYRALGIPARYATGYLTAVQKDVTTMVTALNAHAWVEVYIDGIGWIKVEPTPPMELESPSDDAEPPIQSLGLFKVSSDDEADLFLKTNSYCDYTGNGWDEAYEYTETMFGGYSAQYLTGMAIGDNSNYLPRELEITPLAGLYALPYYVTTDGSHTIQTSDRVVSGDTNESYTVSYYSTIPDGAKGKSAVFAKFEEKYLAFVNENYLNIDPETYAYMNYLIESQGWQANDINIVALVCKYLKSNYNATWSYDEALDESKNYVIDFFETYKEGSPEHFAAAATLIFRALGIPARFTEGYTLSVPENSVSVVTFEDSYFWVEIYREGCGWVMVDVLGKHTMREDGGDEQEVDLFQVYADSDEERIYLKQESFGNFTGREFYYMENIYGEYLDGYGAAYITGMLIEKGIYSEHSIYINMLTDEYDIGYMLPYYMPAYNYGAEIQYSDVSVAGPSNSNYGAKYYDYDLIASIEKYPELAKFESQYREFVYNNYLDTYDYETYNYIYQNIILPYGFDKSNPNVIDDVANCIQNWAEYDLKYDKKLDTKENVVISFLDEYRTGVCRHYAMAATMVYRSLGIPARYTVGFVTPTKADEWVTVTSNYAHAWVEVYVDGFGWKPVEVTGGFQIDDEMKVEAVEIILDDTDKKFDGGDYYPSVGYRGFEKYEKMGYSLSITPYVPFTMPGSTKIQLAGYTVFDAQGNDVSEKFNITLDKDSGECFTYIDEIVIYSNSGTLPYSGYTYSGMDFGYTVNGADIGSFYFENEYSNYTGQYHTVEIVESAQITDVGTVSNKFKFIVNYNGEDVTRYYKINHTGFGDVTVVPRNITLKPENATLSFDEYVMDYMPYNRPFTHSIIEVMDNIEDINDGLAYGHFVGFMLEGEDDRVTTGEIYLPGKVENSVIESKIIILNEFGEDVTKNYNIMTEIGYLEIS